MFISFEGSEGSGKSTQINMVAPYLRELGYDVLTTREPGGTKIGDQVRAILADLGHTEMNPRTEILLFQASRAQLVEEVILPELGKGRLILCDRYADSTLAYQGYGYGHNLEQLSQIVKFATGGLKPDLTLFLDVDVETGLKRRTKGGQVNRLDTFEVEFYRRVREGYHKMVEEEPERWVVIDANVKFTAVQEVIRQVLKERLPAPQQTRG